MEEFFVEGRYFPDSLQAFTFAGIQADRMGRAVEVRTQIKYGDTMYNPGTGPWHSTAQPSNYVRRHLVRES